MKHEVTQTSVIRLSITAVFMAMNIVMSSFGIPVPGDHLYLCDIVICLASILLNPFEAFVAGFPLGCPRYDSLLEMGHSQTF